MRTTIKKERNAQKYQRILGVDSSTTGIAWTLMVIKNGELVGPEASGKVRLDKIKEMQDKIIETAKGFKLVLEEHNPDHVFVEKSIFVKNPDTARKLSFIVGCLMTVAGQEGIDMTLVEPATWKAYIGYHNLHAKFQAEAKLKLGKTEGKKLCDRLRKEQTQRIMKRKWTHFNVEDDDVSDSCAIACYGVNQLAVELLFEKNKEVAFNLPELSSLGLSF